MSEIESIYHFDCRCEDFRHNIRFNVENDTGDVYLSTHINHCCAWYKRVWRAVRYIFKLDAIDGHYDVTFIKYEDYDKIRDVLMRSEIASAAYFSRIREQLAQE
jgi:hypothetical protein